MIACSFPTVGNTILIPLSFEVEAGAVTSCAGGTVTDSQGGGYTLAVESPMAQFVRSLIWVKHVTVQPSGTFTITVTCPSVPSTTSMRFRLMEVVGLTANPLDRTGFASGLSLTSLTVQTSGAMSASNELALVILTDTTESCPVLRHRGNSLIHEFKGLVEVTVFPFAEI